jgi:TfoX/Sxy family transcriptional regulator of competence genes
MKMSYHYCTGRSRPGRSALGRIYHGSRVRGGHSSNTLIVLIDAISASQKLRIAPAILEAAAEHRMIPYYRIAGQIRFDPVELDRWVRKHRIDEFAPEID